MKRLSLCLAISTLFAAALALCGCQRSADQIRLLEERVTNLEARLADTYKPGLGDLMSGIQVHHAKLWFAGQNENWKLAEFELHEIDEGVEDIRNYQGARKESQLIDTLSPAMARVRAAVKQRDADEFAKSYAALTTACNDCHRATNFEFNVVKTPDRPPFDNQDFKLPDAK